ncbi:MAG: tetratricopeptide repeat protein [Candidatus Krumholzibacteriia bacterium]
MRRVGLTATIILLVAGCATFGDHARVATTPEHINTQKAKAQALMEAGDYQAAAALLRPLAEKKVKNGQLYAMLGKCYWKLGAHDDAVAQYEAALRLDYGGSGIHLDLAAILMEMGRTGRALTEFDLAVRYGNRDPLAHYNYGLALFELGRGDQALGQWETARSLDPRNPMYAEAMGIGLSGTDDEAARSFFELAADLGADTPKFHNNYGLLLKRLGEYRSAESEFGRALELDPGNDAYRFNRAAVLMSAQRYGEAVPLWQSLLSGAPDNRSFRTYLGRALYEEQRFEEVVGLLEDWLETRPTEPTAGSAWSAFDPRAEPGGPGLDEAFGTLAMSFRALGELEKATTYIARALAIEPGNTIHLNNYGVILAENGKITEAKAQWKKVLVLDPDNTTARRNLSALAE